MQSKKKGTYACYVLFDLSAERLFEWMELVGIKKPVPKEELHVTTVYSLVDLPDYFPSQETILLTPENFFISRLGNALVLEVYSHKLQDRYNDAFRNGAVSTYPFYRPHITLSYDVSVNEEFLNNSFIPNFNILLQYEKKEELKEEKVLGSILFESFSNKDKKNISILLRSGLVSRSEVYKAMRALENPEKTILTPDLREILVKIITKLIDFIVLPGNKELFLRLKQRMLKENSGVTFKDILEIYYVNSRYGVFNNTNTNKLDTPLKETTGANSYYKNCAKLNYMYAAKFKKS